MTVKIYCLYDEVSGHIFYVGRTRGTIIGRLTQHINGANAKRGNKTKNEYIAKYLPFVAVKELAVVDYWDSHIREMRETQKAIADGHLLANVYSTNVPREKIKSENK